MARPMDLRDDNLWVRPESNKTKKERLVPLRVDVVNALEEQKARPGDDRTPFFLFNTQSTSIMLARWCRRLKLPVITPHALRQTFGTRCAEAGMYPKHLQLIMGHASIEITVKFNVHLERSRL